MKTGKYTLREFFGNTDLNTIIIPEIQRDYVWGEDQIMKLLESIIEDYNEFMVTIPIKNIVNVSQEIIANFNQFYKKNYLSSNIGFIYAYSDADYPGSYFLIDGQQRFTTIFLTLLVLAANGSNDDRTKFKRTYTNNEHLLKPKVDYRVREASHIFLCKLIQSIDEASNKLSSSWIKEQSWYLQDYDNDTTIKSIINNIDVIAKFLKKKKIIQDSNDSIDKSFLEYIQEYLEFWYFDTNISEQGEELYIYMNARGEFMQAHENLKADLIGKLTTSQDKKTYGEKWEEWQDLFWRNKGNNQNADTGFNEFITCIAGLENVLSQTPIVYSKENFESDLCGEKNKIAYGDILKFIDINVLQDYISALDSLFSPRNIVQFTYRYSYFEWINKAKEEFWKIFNNETTNWFADIMDEDRGTERNRMVFVWSMLKYAKTINWRTEPIDNIYRTFRLFYMRYFNYDRAVKTSLVDVGNDVDNIIKFGPWYLNSLRNGTEEVYKYQYLNNTANTRECESLIWRIEDHPLNLNARDLGNINSSHLVKYSNNPTAQQLYEIYKHFYSIFPINADGKLDKENVNEKKLFNALLFTSLKSSKSAFWSEKHHYYYTLLDFNQMRRIIRGKAKKDNNDFQNDVFDTFFNNFKANQEYPSMKQEEVENMGLNIEKVDGANILWALCWYAARKGEQIWDQGNYISFNCTYDGYKYAPKGITNSDWYFPKVKKITNMKESFNGGSPKCLDSII